MRVVYEAENLIDAHLVRGLLENAGFAVYVRGEYLTGAIGELPVSGLVAVCVAESDLAEAREFLEQWRRDCVALDDDDELPADGGVLVA